MNKDKRQNLWFGIAMGGLLVIIGLLSLLCVCGLFSGVGQLVSSFLLGAFGYFSYAISVCLIILGFAVSFGIKVKMSWFTVLKFVLVFSVGLLAVHIYTSSAHIFGRNYGEYLKSCYASQNTAGGAMFGVLSYPIMKLMTNAGALAFTSLFCLLLSFLCFLPSLKKEISMESKSRDLKKKSKFSKKFGNDDGDSANVNLTQNSDLQNMQYGNFYNSGLPQQNQQYFQQNQQYLQYPNNVNQPMQGQQFVQPQNTTPNFGQPQNMQFNPFFPNQNGHIEDEKTIDKQFCSEGELAKKLLLSPDFDEDAYQKYIGSASDSVIETKAPYSMQKRMEMDEKLGIKRSKSARLSETMKRYNLDKEDLNDDEVVYEAVAYDKPKDKSPFGVAIIPEQTMQNSIEKTEKIDIHSINFEDLKKAEFQRYKNISSKKEEQNFFGDDKTNRENIQANQQRIENISRASKPIRDELANNDSIANKFVQSERKAMSEQPPVPTFDNNSSQCADMQENGSVQDRLRALKEKQRLRKEMKEQQKEQVSAYDKMNSVKEIAKEAIENPLHRPTAVEKPFINNAPQFYGGKEKTYKQISVEEELKKSVVKKPYIAPPLSLLSDPAPQVSQMEELESKKHILVNTLASFGVKAYVEETIAGPTTSMYIVKVEMPGKTINWIHTLKSNIEMKMEGEVTIYAPLIGRDAIGFEVPNKIRRYVNLKEILNSPQFNDNPSPTNFAVGIDINGDIHTMDVSDLPHMLIAGSTGSGKSCGLNSIIVSMLYKATPDDVRMIMIDPKCVELTMYEGIPHLLTNEIIYDVDKAIKAFNWCVKEMESRNAIFRDAKVQNIKQYNAICERAGMQKLPRIVVFVDELADLIDSGKKSITGPLDKIARLARAAGIHLVLATQRPSVDVISGTIKNNLPTRMVFRLALASDSRTVTGQGGAEKLLGNGDMQLMLPTETIRMQGAFVGGSEIRNVVKFVTEHNVGYFDEEIEQEFNKDEEVEEEKNDDARRNSRRNKLPIEFFKGLEIGLQGELISKSMLQGRFGIGFPKSSNIFESMKARGLLATAEGSNKGCKLLLSREQFDEMLEESDFTQEDLDNYFE